MLQRPFFKRWTRRVGSRARCSSASASDPIRRRRAPCPTCEAPRAYQVPSADEPVILLLPAPIKTACIWDLAAGASVVRRCRAAGLQVYLASWHRTLPGDEARGLDEYADRALGACLDAITAETAQPKAFLAGHSLGGTLAAIFASLHPERVRGLIELEGPMAFGAGALETAASRAPPALGGEHVRERCPLRHTTVARLQQANISHRRWPARLCRLHSTTVMCRSSVSKRLSGEATAGASGRNCRGDCDAMIS